MVWQEFMFAVSLYPRDKVWEVGGGRCGRWEVWEVEGVSYVRCVKHELYELCSGA